MALPAPPEPYRPADLITLAGWLKAAARCEWWRLVREFLKEYSHEPPPHRVRLLATQPPSTGDLSWDVLLAGLAEHLSARDGFAAPDWCESRQLDAFWFPFDSPAARTDAIVHAPAAFRRRGVFVAAREIDVR